MIGEWLYVTSGNFHPQKIHPTIGRIENTQYFQPTYRLLERRLKPTRWSILPGSDLYKFGIFRVWLNVAEILEFENERGRKVLGEKSSEL